MPPESGRAGFALYRHPPIAEQCCGLQLSPINRRLIGAAGQHEDGKQLDRRDSQQIQDNQNSVRSA